MRRLRKWIRLISPGLMESPCPLGVFYSSQKNLTLGIEVCEDLWAPHPPSTDLALAGADIILNLSASNELVAKSDYRRLLVETQSARLMSGYLLFFSRCWRILHRCRIFRSSGHCRKRKSPGPECDFQTSSEFITLGSMLIGCATNACAATPIANLIPVRSSLPVHFNGTIAVFPGLTVRSAHSLYPAGSELMSRRCKRNFLY